MKNIIFVAGLMLCVPASAVDTHAADVAKADAAKGQTKQVCKDVQGKDGNPVKNKDGSVKQACKTIKIHKKHEGTEIPPKK